jgi:hypothetical protein
MLLEEIFNTFRRVARICCGGFQDGEIKIARSVVAIAF